MSWTATLNIVNDTDYNLTVNHNTAGDLVTIEPGGSWTYTTSDSNYTNALRFWQQPDQWYMQASVSFGPTAGVSYERGTMAPEDQTIRLDGNIDDQRGHNVEFWQIGNGVYTVAPWDGFDQGVIIDMKFSPRTWMPSLAP